jgi:hypothetical protein
MSGFAGVTALSAAHRMERPVIRALGSLSARRSTAVRQRVALIWPGSSGRLSTSERCLVSETHLATDDNAQTICVCGHTRAEHRHERFPLSTECFAIETDCECSGFRDVREVLEEAKKEHTA